MTTAIRIQKVGIQYGIYERGGKAGDAFVLSTLIKADSARSAANKFCAKNKYNISSKDLSAFNGVSEYTVN